MSVENVNAVTKIVQRDFVNPRISFNPIRDKRTYVGSKLKITNLYSALKYCENMEGGSEKGTSGVLLPYVSNRQLSVSDTGQYNSDGVIFIDIDYNKRSKEIYEGFDQMCDRIPTLLAMNYSHSRKLHLYLYDPVVKDGPDKYRERYLLWMAVCAKVIKELFGIDLRDEDGAMDSHNAIWTQKLFAAPSTFQWRQMEKIYADQPFKFSTKDKKILMSEYSILFAKDESKRSLLPSTVVVEGSGDIMVDRDFNILGWSGWDARTRIVATAFFHFNKNIDDVKRYIYSTYKNSTEMWNQFESMFRNDRLERFYSRDVEKYLFKKEGDVYKLDDGEYISQVIDIDELLKTDKYIYIQSNTGTGKTEFVKELLKRYDDKLVLIQQTIALREGKKEGIEEYTFGNWDKLLSKEKVHITIDKAVREMSMWKMEDYVVVVDESHLLEEYVDIRSTPLLKFIDLLSDAKKVIFMSATPTSDLKLFPFRKLEFIKRQDQEVRIVQQPYTITGKGSEEAAKFEYLIQKVKELNGDGYGIVFSNRYQEEWKKYGLDGDDVTKFNSYNVEDEHVKSILLYNRLDNHITLATKYLGCGVEIKGYDEVNIFFDLNEGWNINFIEQSIGRPRASGGVKRVNVYMFYNMDKNFGPELGKGELEVLNEAFENLIVVDGEDSNKYNINVLAARMTGVWNADFHKYSSSDKVKLLKFGNVVTSHSCYAPGSWALLKQLPYKQVIVNNDVQVDIVSKDGKERVVRREDRLLEYLKSLEDWQVVKIGRGEDDGDDQRGYMKEFDSGRVPYEDKINAVKVIKGIKKVIRMHIDFKKGLERFDDKVERLVKLVKYLDQYVRIKSGEDSLKEFKGSNEMMEKVVKELDAVEKIFNPEFLKLLIERRTGIYNMETVPIEDEFLQMMGLGDMEIDVDPLENHLVEPFKSREEVKKESRKDAGKTGGKIGGLKKKSIRIRRLSDGVEFEFDSKTDAMNWLGWSSARFSRFVKEGTDKRVEFVIES